MSLPSQPRDVSTILNDLKDRVRVLEALPRTQPLIADWISYRDSPGSPTSVPDSTYTFLPISDAGSSSDPGDLYVPPGAGETFITVNEPGFYMCHVQVRFTDPALFEREVYVIATNDNPPAWPLSTSSAPSFDSEAEFAFDTAALFDWRHDTTVWYDLKTTETFPIYVAGYLYQESGGAIDAVAQLSIYKAADASG